MASISRARRAWAASASGAMRGGKGGDEVLREALHNFVSRAKTLDTASLFTHLGSLGLDGQARVLQTQTRAEFRLAPDASPAEAARNWWSLYELMDFSIDMLRTQRDEAQALWLANPDDRAACDRLMRYNELLTRARSGAAGLEEI